MADDAAVTLMPVGDGTPEDHRLDPGIALHVHTLQRAGVETFQSCQGGPGHACPEPTVQFHGEYAEGFRALSVALTYALPVRTLRRVWDVSRDHEPIGPHWEMTFWPPMPYREAPADA